MPKVSVIVPIYNVEKYLRECLDSIVNQTLKDIEIILVNDGSTDNSLSIIEEYAKKDNRIIVVNKENGGLSSARNEGLKYVTGELCYFLDSDDYIDINLFSYAVKIFDRYDIDYLCFGTQAFSDDNDISQDLKGLKQYLRINFRGLQNVSFELAKATNIHVWNKIYKTEKIKQENIRFINGLLYEDIYFVWHYIFMSSKVYYAPYKFHYYRLRKNSIMDDTYKQKSFDLSVSHLLNWYELYKTFCNKGECFVKNYDYLKNLLEVYVEITKEKTKKSEWYKINKLKKRYRDELRKSYGTKFSFKDRFLYNLRKIFSINYDLLCERVYINLFGMKFKIRFSKLFDSYHNKCCSKYLNKTSESAFYSTFCKTNNKNEKLYNEIKSLGNFHFIPNRGNLGDIAIANACYQFFDSNNFNYNVIDMSSKKCRKMSKPFNLVYGGGGLFVSYYREYYQDILEIFRSKKLKKAVICPVSFYDCQDVLDVLDERFTVFCRDEKSYNYAVANNTKAKFVLADDMVFGLNIDFYKNSKKDKNTSSKFITNNKRGQIKNLYYKVYPYYKSVVESIDIVQSYSYKVGCFMRTDNETSGVNAQFKSIADLSLFANSFCADKSLCVLLLNEFLRALDTFEVIITDRLHIGICSMLLGKKVYLIDNSYKKLSNVYQKSMSYNSNVMLVDNIKKLEEELLDVDMSVAHNNIAFSEDSFESFIGKWTSIKNNFGVEKVFWGE